MPEPLVTVLLPVFNARPYVRASVLSILAQDYRNLEVLVIDDGSTDGSRAILEELAERDRRIRLISRENRGLISTLNQGLDLASGEYVARMDADDIAYPTRISDQVKVFEQHPGTCLVGTAVDYLYGDDRLLRKPFPEVTQQEIMIELLFHPFFFHPTVMFDNSVLVRQGIRYDSSYTHCEDFDLWRRISRQNSIRYINKPRLAWRQGYNSVRMRHAQEMHMNSIRIISDQLIEHEILTDTYILHHIPGLWHQGRECERQQLISLLDTIWKYPGFSGSNRKAYERGVCDFADRIISTATSSYTLRMAINTLKSSEIYSSLSLKGRLLGAVNSFLNYDAAQKVINNLQAATRLLRYKRMSKLVGLPEDIANFTAKWDMVL